MLGNATQSTTHSAENSITIRVVDYISKSYIVRATKEELAEYDFDIQQYCQNNPDAFEIDSEDLTDESGYSVSNEDEGLLNQWEDEKL